MEAALAELGLGPLAASPGALAARLSDALAGFLEDRFPQVAAEMTYVPRGAAPLLMIFGGLFVVSVSLAVAMLRARSEQKGWRVPSSEAGDAAWVPLGAMVGALCGLAVYFAGYAAILLSAPPPPLRGLGAQDALAHVMGGLTYWEVAMAGAGAALGAAVARYRWRSGGLLSYVGLTVLVLGYLLYTTTSSLPRVPEGQRPFSLVLLVAEAGSLLLVLVSAFYSLDVHSRRRWARLPGRVPFSQAYQPRVAIQVPVFNEPVDLVRVTLDHLAAQDYPRDRFVVQVLDDSTDPATRAAVQAHAEALGLQVVHRADRRGYKAGALNHATRLLPPDVELVAVIDADYWVERHYLSSTVGHFVDPRIGFLQTPQDYRNVHESFLTGAYYDAEGYFYHAILPSRNEENAIIFCGTMGIVRRSALDSIGGWAEDQICEDAEVSVRLAAHGWGSLYVDRTFGKGLMPAVYDAYKKQFHRWAFGNVRMLTTHLGRILRSPMSWRQKFDFVAGNLHWFDGVFVTTIALALMWVAMGELGGSEAVTHHQRELALLGLIPVFLLVDGFTRIHLALGRAAVRRGRRPGIRATLRVLGLWFAIKFTNMRAALQSLSGQRAPFVRTPKSPGGRLGRAAALARALRLSPAESAMALALGLTAAAVLQRALPLVAGARGQGLALLALWLALYGLMFACAPIYAYLSYRTLVPQPPSPPSRPRAGPRAPASRVGQAPPGSQGPAPAPLSASGGT